MVLRKPEAVLCVAICGENVFFAIAKVFSYFCKVT